MEIQFSKVKIAVTIPVESVAKIRKAVFKAGAGIIGNYSYCSVSTKCTGTFMPNEKANPYLGKKNKLEFVQEERLEILCDVGMAKKILATIKKNHPYEEPVIDIIPLLDETIFK